VSIQTQSESDLSS